MSEYIQYELWALFFFCLSGMAAALTYDVLKALRRVIPHSTAAVGAEDLFYWTADFSYFIRYFSSVMEI